MSKEIIIIKVGTSSVTDSKGNLDTLRIENIAQQLSLLNSKYNLVLVSSGAVGTGRKFIKDFSGKISERKAAAAIGNPILMNYYANFFGKKNIVIAQSLCERQHFSDRKKFLQLKSTFEELWNNNIIPIANENDVVSDLELKFSDNDELATLLAVGLGAQKLLIGSSVNGVLDHNNKTIPLIEDINEEIMSFARNEKSTFGLGGMISKLTFARLATRLGIEVVIFKTQEENSVLNAMDNNTGTVCLAKSANKSARQKWLASGSIAKGRIKIDDGAEKALLNRKSLLAVGIISVEEEFQKGEVFDIADKENNIIALARAKIASKDIELGKQKLEVAHADDIVII
jgi:glutamate 5-kinase